MAPCRRWMPVRYDCLPINGVASGFSGATASILMGRLIVTTSVEDTDNAYDDGCVLGSFVGWVPIAERSRSENYVFVQIESGQHALKVESVAVEHEHSEDEMTVLMTTDSDGGTSVALRCLLRWSAI
jgi:hypothetical protein